ncbi:hypothetical protein [Legionella sp. 28fT52]|uniref:hypothetical protein n=1 Tax=Legionella sp. 28fT52 TaxID=3410134 RepID=UPI003AF50D04
MATKERTQEIVSHFSRYLISNDKALIENLSLEELEAADTDLGWRDVKSSHRLAMQKRINELKEQNSKRVSAIKFYIGIIVTITIAIIGWLFFNR